MPNPHNPNITNGVEFGEQCFDLSRAYAISPSGHPYFCILSKAEFESNSEFFSTVLCASFNANLRYIFDHPDNIICLDRRILALKGDLFNCLTFRRLHDDNGITYTNIPIRDYSIAEMRGQTVDTYLRRYLPNCSVITFPEIVTLFTEQYNIWKRTNNEESRSFWYISFFHRQSNLPDWTSVVYYGTAANNLPSLEEVIAHVKRQNINTYFFNQNNDAHAWLTIYYRVATDKATFLEQVGKGLGYPVVEVFRTNIKQPLIVPRQLTRAIHYTTQKIFYLLKDFEKYKHEIKWCSYHKDWYHLSCFVKYGKMVGKTARLFEHAVPLPFKLEVCSNCNTQWVENSFLPHPQTEENLCPTCITKQVQFTNPPHTYNRIIGEYHSHRHNASWTFLIQRTKSNVDKHELPIGIEIEVQAKPLQGNSPPIRGRLERPRIGRDEDRDEDAANAAWDIYQAEKEYNPDWHNIYFEWDGSLKNGGFEIITNPMTMRYHQQYWTVMLPIMRKYVNGWYVNQKKESPSADQSTYGIHLTCHTKYWKDLWLVRLARFCAEIENKNFINAMAQRAVLYGGGNRYLGGMNKPKVSELFQKETAKLKSSDRSNIFLKRPLVEIRMFRSTLNTESFLKNIEFLTAFWHWCQSTAWNTSAIDFIKWFSPQEKLYPHLLSYMTRDKFSCKNRTLYDNEFKEFFKPKYIIGQSELFVPETTTPEQQLLLEDQGDLV